MFSLKTLQDARIRNQRVIVRVDFNEPLIGGRLGDDFRIRSSLPTIHKLLSGKNQLVLISHLGRPDGRKKMMYSMQPVARHLARLVGREVVFIRDPFHPRERARLSQFIPGRVFMIENIRFWPEEEKNNKKFAKDLAAFGDFFINDAFGASHRAHASISGIPAYLPSAAGLLLEREITALGRMLHHQRRPFFVILAGGKASTKVELAKKFLRESDGVLLGGAIANSILASRGFEIGKSISYHEIRDMKKHFNVASAKLFTPLDVVTTERISALASAKIKLYSHVLKTDYIVDIGPKTVSFFTRLLSGARTVLWNGPMGVTEISKFSRGTLGLVRGLRKIRGYKVTGGGDTVALLRKHHAMDVFNHVSTGGGAMLEYLAGKKMPGIEALRKK